MQLKSAVTIVLTSVFSLSWSTNVLAEVKAKYDAFQDKTTISVLGERQHNRPRLHVWHQSDGKRPDSKQSALVGFLINQACTNPNFLADGKRVQPEAGRNSPTDPNIMTNDLSGDPDIQNILGLFTFNFYNLP
jgi:hypothetical protein